MEDTSKGAQVIMCIYALRDSLKHAAHHRYRDLNLTGPQGMLIGILFHNGKMKVSDISIKLCLSNSTVSGILDRLEKQNMIERSRSDSDRRVVYVDIASDFKKLSKNRFMELEKSIEEKINRATPAELEVIISGLNALKKILDE
jgi:MarR family transcriptional regulator, organic hydroperoxide resistance regulator